jgi:hypothetical protein
MVAHEITNPDYYVEILRHLKPDVFTAADLRSFSQYQETFSSLRVIKHQYQKSSA